MKLEDSTTSLEITTEDAVAMDVPYTLRVRAGEAFCAHCLGVFFIVGPRVRDEFTRFEEFKTQTIEIGMSVGGLLALHRHVRGGFRLDYEIRDDNVADRCCLKGRIEVDGESAAVALSELKRMMFSKLATE